MKIDPGFINHWKTERLIAELGAEGVVAVLRLWGNAQIKRQWKGLELTPRRLALETKWKTNEEHLFSVLTDPDAPWLDLADDGTYSIHGFEEHQKQVIHLWTSASKAGKPKRETPKNEEKKEKESSSYSSSYPICETNEEQMFSNGGGVDGSKTRNVRRPTQKQAMAYGPTIGIPADHAAHWWNKREANDWIKGSGGGGSTPVGSNWQADLAASRGWIAKEMADVKTTTPPPVRRFIEED